MGALTAIALLAVPIVAGCGAIGHGAYDQTYLAAGHNWAFRHHFPSTDRLFNAFDYGHATLYEALLDRADPARVDGERFQFVTQHVLRHAPSVPLVESAIGARYVNLVPEVAAMFDWAHMLHRQLYDIWAEYGLDGVQRDEAVARALAYYRSRRDLAFSARPKSMDLMEGQPYSLAFRRRDPKFNGLLWSYHWLQMALYDALIVGRGEGQLQHDVDSLVTRFFSAVDDPLRRMPELMPLSAAVAPVFSQRYPEAAIIFDNLHALHDVVADILVSDAVAPRDKRAAILVAARAYRDDITGVVTVEEWRMMARTMSGTIR